MAKPLRVLIVEDSEDDALLVIHALKRGSYDTTFERVETAEAMTAALEKQVWDIIISDYSLPHFSAPEALELFHQSGLDLPFIVISGTIGEETAVATMQAGAHDYLMKNNLKRLVPTIERELREAEVRKERKKAEEGIRIFSNTIASSINAVAIADLEGNLTYINHAFLRMWGYDDEKEVLGRSAVEFWQIAEQAVEVMQLAMDREGWIGELAAKRKDGSIFDVLLSSSVVRDEAGRSICRAGSFIDITERKQAEEMLEVSENNFRNTLDNSPLGIRIVTAEGELLYTNQAILDIYGYSSVEELKATSTKKHYTPESYAKHQERLKMRNMGKPTPPSYETSIVRKNGEIRHLMTSRKAVMWGGEVQYQVIYQDITERKRAEENVKRAAEEWTTTFDSITDLVSICDNDFRLVRVNKAFADLLKKKPVELIGKHCYEIIHGTKEPVPNCPHNQTIKTKKPAMAEFFEPHLGIHLEVMTSPIFNEEGEVEASVHVTRDISERKRMEEQLILTDRLASIGELASGIAHELNNPLTSVIGFSELLLEKDIPEDVREDLGVINREAKRTAMVVSNLLAFARKHPEEKQSVDVNKVIQGVLELRAYEQKINNIQVITQFASDLPKITADSFRLQQVFLNIIINAEHFMTEAHRRGILTITTERVGDIIRTSFTDDGSGIAKENLGHLFDPFFTTKEVGKGTGLGLSICHGIITEHGGRIHAESELGKGATFVIEMPITKR